MQIHGKHKCCVQYMKCKKIHRNNGKEHHFRYKWQAQIHLWQRQMHYTKNSTESGTQAHGKPDWPNHKSQTASLIIMHKIILRHLSAFIWSMRAVRFHRLCITGIKCLLWFLNTNAVQHRGILLWYKSCLLVNMQYRVMQRIFIVETYIKKKFYKKCHTNFTRWLPGVLISLKLIIHWPVDKFQTSSLLMKKWQQVQHVLSEET
jgi:uncharacterized membrane protein